MKQYKCCICHKTLNYKPIRMVKQLYGVGKYKQYSTVNHYDFCQRCYLCINNWIGKHQKEEV